MIKSCEKVLQQLFPRRSTASIRFLSFTLSSGSTGGWALSKFSREITRSLGGLEECWAERRKNDFTGARAGAEPG